MALGENAPQYFSAGLTGTAFEGPVMILSFGTPIPSEDHASRKYLTNVRIAMPVGAVKQMLDFIAKSLEKAEQETGAVHPMPGQTQ